MPRILVTGASGFIGSALCRRLEASGYEVYRLSSHDGNVADDETFSRIRPVEHVFHLAGRTYVPDSWCDPMDFHRSNAVGTGNVLEYCRRHGASLCFVSAYLYGAKVPRPVSEQYLPKPNNPYALSKYLAEKMCEFYAENFGINVTVLRPFNIFGPGQKGNFLIPHVISQARRGGVIQVNDLAPKRDYLYIDDLVDSLVATINRCGAYSVLNIGSGESISVGDLIELIQVVMGTRLPVICSGIVRPNEISDVCADISRAQSILGWKPKLSLREGIEHLMQKVSSS